VKAATVRVDVRLPNGDEGNGTGFLVHPEGLLVTNAHVVGYSRREGNRPARSVKVVFNCGEPTQRVLQAQVFGVDGDGDLAVLRVAPGGLPEALTLGTATLLRETQDLYVFGYPLGDIAGREITVSTTTVSSLRRENRTLTAVQVNGGMHPGNSGGPLTDKGGQVVGVAVAGIKGTNIHFAIPADQVDQFVRDQIASGTGKIKPATVIARPPSDPEDPPFLPPSLLRPPGMPRPPFGPRR
jgi:S1-C subfamily serine protease